MPEEKADQSVKNAAAPNTAGSQVQAQTRLPDEPGKPKRKRRRRSRHRSHRSQVPDSVTAERQTAVAMTGTVSSQSDHDDLKKQKDSENQSANAKAVSNDEPSKKQDLPDKVEMPAPVKLNGKPYYSHKSVPQEQKNIAAPLGSTQDKDKRTKWGKKESAGKKVRQALAGQQEVAPTDKKKTKEIPVLASGSTPKEEVTTDSDVVVTQETHAGEQVRFTPHLRAGDLKSTVPTFSLQDIQRARRRRRLVSAGVILVLLAAAYVFWAGTHKARENNPVSAPVESVASSAPVAVGGEKATLSGTVQTEGLQFPSVTLDRVAIYIRYDGEGSFRDTGIRLMQGEPKWSFSQANDGKTYDVQAVLIDNGREIAYSNVVTVEAPAAGIYLVFPASAKQTLEQMRPQVQTEPVLQVGEVPAIAGTVRINGQVPEQAQIVIWLGENTGEEQISQEAYTFGVGGAETGYTISSLTPDKEYVLDAVVQTADGQVLGQADRSLFLHPGATDANFDVTIR